MIGWFLGGRKSVKKCDMCRQVIAVFGEVLCAEVC